MRYWLQLKAPAGNWYDSIGTSSINDAISYAEDEVKRGATARVVERRDIEVWSFEAPSKPSPWLKREPKQAG